MRYEINKNYEEARNLLREGAYSFAEELFFKNYKEDPKNNENTLYLGISKMKVATIYEGEKSAAKLDEAALIFKKLLQTNLKEKAKYNLVKIYTLKNDFEKASKYYYDIKNKIMKNDLTHEFNLIKKEALKYLEESKKFNALEVLEEENRLLLKAHNLDRENRYILYPLGVTYYLKGDFNNSLKIAEKLKLTEGKNHGLCLEGSILIQKNNLIEAKNIFKSLVNTECSKLAKMKLNIINKKQRELYLINENLKAESIKEIKKLYYKDDFKSVITIADNSLKTFKEDAEILLFKAKSLRKLTEINKALNIFYSIENSKFKEEVLKGMAYCFLSKESFENLDKYIIKYKDTPYEKIFLERKENLGSKYSKNEYSKGYKHYKNKNLEEALTCFLKCYEYDKNNHFAVVKIAAIYNLLTNYKEAIKYSKLLIDNDFAKLELSKALAGLQIYDEALEILDSIKHIKLEKRKEQMKIKFNVLKYKYEEEFKNLENKEITNNFNLLIEENKLDKAFTYLKDHTEEITSRGFHKKMLLDLSMSLSKNKESLKLLKDTPVRKRTEFYYRHQMLIYLKQNKPEKVIKLYESMDSYKESYNIRCLYFNALVRLRKGFDLLSEIKILNEKYNVTEFKEFEILARSMIKPEKKESFTSNFERAVYDYNPVDLINHIKKHFDFTNNAGEISVFFEDFNFQKFMNKMSLNPKNLISAKSRDVYVFKHLKAGLSIDGDMADYVLVSTPAGSKKILTMYPISGKDLYYFNKSNEKKINKEKRLKIR